MKQKNFILLFACIIFACTVFLRGGCGPELATKLMSDNVEALANGENGYSCSASANCYEEYYDFKTEKWEKREVGAVSCTGTENCQSGAGYVVCDGTISECK